MSLITDQEMYLLRNRGVYLLCLCLLLPLDSSSLSVNDNYVITTEFDISSVNLGSSLSTTGKCCCKFYGIKSVVTGLAILDVTAMSACAQKCSAHTDCVAAIHDGSNNKCYLWSSLIKVEKSSNSGVSLLHIMCAEQQMAVSWSPISS